MSRSHRSSSILALSFFAAFVTLAGCGRTSAPVASSGATPASTGSSGQVATDALSATMQAGDTLVHGPCAAFGLPIMIPYGCPYDAGTQTFTCGPETEHDGLTVMRGYQFLDGMGNPQPAYDTTTTARIKFSSTVTGTIDEDHRWSQIDDHRELTESGLEGSETTRTWDGSATASHQDSVAAGDGTRKLRSMTASTDVASVVVPAPFHRDSWPLSGTITTHVSNSDGLDLTAVLAFNGTRYASLAVGDSVYTVDLASHGLRGDGHRRGRDGDGGHGGDWGRH